MSAPEKDAKRSRFAVLQASGLPVPMPEEDHPILDTLAELGWCESGAWGPAPLSSREILAWCDGMGDSLTPWEFAMLRRLSAAYVDGAADERAPYKPVIVRMGLATAAFIQ